MKIQYLTAILIIASFLFTWALEQPTFRNLQDVPLDFDTFAYKPSPDLSCTGSNIFANSSRNTYLTILSRGDGTGAQLQHFIYGASYAYYRKWNYGGYFTPHHFITVHGLYTRTIFDFFFGNHTNVHGVLLPSNVIRVPNLSVLESVDGSASNITYDYQLPHFDLEYLCQDTLDKYLNEKFLRELRIMAACGVSKVLQGGNNTVYKNKQPIVYENVTIGNTGDRIDSSKNLLRVVAHIRRGDVTADAFLERFIPEELFIALMTTVARVYNAFLAGVGAVVRNHTLSTNGSFSANTELHAFTSFENDEKSRNESIRMVSKFKQHNISLHVTVESNNINNTQHTLKDLAHMLTADVLILSKSSFSSVPALFNPNCVVYIPFWHKPLQGWIKLPADVNNIADAVKVIESELPACLRRIFQTSPLLNQLSLNQSNSNTSTMSVKCPTYIKDLSRKAVKSGRSKEIFFVENCTRHSIPNWDKFLSMKIPVNEIIYITDNVLDSIVLGDPL